MNLIKNIPIPKGTIAIGEVGLTGEVRAINTLVAAGVGAATIGAAIVYFQADSVAAIDGNANIEDANIESITVKTVGKTNAKVVSASMGIGGATVNAGFAMATNRSTARTYIGKDVKIICNNATIDIDHDYSSDANAIMVSVSVGSAAVGATVTIVINALDAVSYVGTIDKRDENSDITGLINAKALNVNADAKGTSSVIGAGASGGVIAANGIVALAFNTIINKAVIGRMPIKLNNGDLNVIAVIEGNTDVDVVGLTGGAIAVGAVVAFADSHAENAAIIELGEEKTFGEEKYTISAADIKIEAGTEANPNNARAMTTVISGTIAEGSVLVNIAIARNAGVNDAKITGTGNCGILKGNNITVHAIGDGRAYSVIASAAGGLTFEAGAAVAYAWTENTQYAGAETEGSILADGNLEVLSQQNSGDAMNKHVDMKVAYSEKKDNGLVGKLQSLGIDFDSTAKAYIFSAGIGGVSAHANAAAALSNSTSKAILKAKRTDAKEVSIINNA